MEIMNRSIIVAPCILFLAVNALCTAAAQERESAESNVHEFTSKFFTDEHMIEVVQALDSLRNAAVQNVFDISDFNYDSDLPRVKTSSGILMLYSVIKIDTLFYHKFSVSRAPYLARAFGKCLVGMACERFALPDPETIGLSARHVFHADWILTSQEHMELLAAEIPARPASVEGLKAKAMLRGMSIEIIDMEIDYESMPKKER
jgi:hypothetical protein